MNPERKGPVALLKEHLEQLGSDCRLYKDKYLRAVADYENYRRRIERDLGVSQREKMEALVMDLLPVVDDMRRAAEAASGEDDAAGMRKGLELISRRLRDALCRHGLEEYSCRGQGFDPRRAEAVSFVHSDKHAPNTVVEEVCSGYSCGGRVIRPARVVVAMPPAGSAESGDDGSQLTAQ
jgi:molecular chaperone GrpE